MTLVTASSYKHRDRKGHTLSSLCLLCAFVLSHLKSVYSYLSASMGSSLEALSAG